MNKIQTKLKWLISHYSKVFLMGCKEATNKDLKILHQSNNFIIVDKGCDIVINADNPEDHPVTVATQLNHTVPHLADPSVSFGFRFCHRLDYSTSGVLIIALNKNAAKQAYNTFFTHKAKKFYLALLHGHLKENQLTIDKSIGNDSRPDFSHCMCTGDKEYCTDTRSAVSKLLVLQRGTYCGKPATKVLMQLLTGRRHQLRVHCQDIGHTIIGDFTYSNRSDIFPYRMFLHSLRISFPCSLEPLDVMTDDPFTEKDERNFWCPIETVCDLNEAFDKI